MNNLLVLPLVVAMFCLCVSCQNQDDEYPLQDRLANAAVFRTADQLGKAHGVRLIGFGGGRNHDTGKDNRISMALELRKDSLVSKEEARRLLIDSVFELLDTINSDPELTQYIEPVPFEVRNLRVDIYIYDVNGHLTNHPHITVVGYADNLVEYITIDPDNEYQYKAIVSESFEDALKKAEIAQEQDNPKQAPEDEILDRVADKVQKIFSDRYGLRVLVYKAGNDGQSKIDKIFFELETNYLVDLEEARRLVFNCVDDIVDVINSDSALGDHFSPYPFTAENVDLEFVMRDENGKYPEPPLIGTIRLAGGKIVYSTNYSTYPLPDGAIITETYAEARQKNETNNN